MQNDTLDAIDRRLMAQLQHDGRITNLDLATAIQLSPAQCNRRHKRLEEDGFIQGYQARIAAHKLGWGVQAFIQVTMERGHIKDVDHFRDAVGAMEQVQECYAVTGDADYVLKVICRDLKSLSDFLLRHIMQLPGVSAVRSSVCLDEVKCTQAVPMT